MDDFFKLKNSWGTDWGNYRYLFYVITFMPSDFPVGTKYVMRRWELVNGTHFPLEAKTAETLSAARLLIPERARLYCIKNNGEWDPVILESWF